MNFVEELKWRGMIHDIMPGTEELMAKEKICGYAGFDPTAESLHVGNLVPVMLLTHLQRCGHTPIVLLGGATGMVGDPSGKSDERNLLSIDIIEKNLAGQQKQLEKFLNFSDGDNKAVMLNNYDWFKEFSFLDFIRDVGKHMTVNYMMAKDSVKNRLETGMSFTEFSYQLVQGYDFFYLNKNHQCKLQVGGSDQWGNIVTGTELIRRMGGDDAFALTAPLIKKADGSKFGKSEEGNVWLDPNLTSPYKFYQFWLNCSDEDSKSYIKIFTLLGKDEIDSLIEEHDKDPGFRVLQKRMAEEITAMVHSKEELQKAQDASKILFGKSTTDQLKTISEDMLLSVFDGVPKFDIAKSELQNKIDVVDLLTEKSQVFPSKNEARKMIKGGGVSINKQKVTSNEQMIGSEDLLNDKYILVQRGKKNYYLLSAN
ncbi:MAG: tyrosine--tRNA ligase [Bacteroidia bacterium]|nr:tyrosine--tRNA ligase [Bacteroidia bacterium]NNC85645.1 tyrosine--tRNA ligase [Bacteroidia bacterium]NNM16354.1 tyrosine--tRNA ligase [Bacteroidia bacterium]